MPTPIITSLLDMDLYKFTVQQMVLHRFSNVNAVYSFTCRNADKIDFFKYVTHDLIKQHLGDLELLTLTAEEGVYLGKADYVKSSYHNHLLCTRLNPKIHLDLKQVGEKWTLKARGPWLNIILFETLVLSIVNELYAREYIRINKLNTEDILKTGRERLTAKIEFLKAYNEHVTHVPALIEFGTRRRFSAAWQEEVLETLKRELPTNLIGTSNVHLAHKYNLKAIGTFGHEYVMALQGLFPLQHAQKQAFRIWLEEYEGKWGIALTDTYGDPKFCHDFSLELARGFDGVRHDSGDPIAFGEMMIAHYLKLGIDPKTKRIVFSDGLDFPEMVKIHKCFEGRINVSFGIGTNLTNDMGIPVPQVVMKVVECHGQPVAKLSNNPSKNSCEDEAYFKYLVHAVNNFITA